ncbi:MAG: zinc ribbon domain-containing protein [Betaproteobacteria bacterium]
MTLHVRVCRECGEEYRPEAQRCADCGGELEDRQLDEEGNPIGGEEEAEEAPEPVAVERRVVFVTPRAAEMVPLAEALREAAIEYHLAEQPATAEGAAPRYALLVREEDATQALRALAPLIAPEDEPEGLHAVDSRFEPEHGYAECPACGAAQPPGAAECAECGLMLGAAEEGAAVCARCSAPLPEPGAACPACGSGPIG